VLGKGGFGLVYLAHDDQRRRFVAIKVPHRKLVDRPETYLAEAGQITIKSTKPTTMIMDNVFASICSAWQKRIAVASHHIKKDSVHTDRMVGT
jgi:serine/threonine protein kinase